MMSCFNKRTDVESTTNEVEILRAVEERTVGIALPYCRDVKYIPNKISILQYPMDLATALRTGCVDPCGSIIVRVIKRIKEMCGELYNANVVHYDLHTRNIALKFLGVDSTCMPDVRFIDWVLTESVCPWCC